MRIGPFTLTRLNHGFLWLENMDGEGMEISELELIRLFGKYWKEQF
jgi:hypothetical protein